MNQNSPRDAQLAEMKFMLSIPLARESVRRAHTLFNQLKKHTLWRYELSSAIFYGIIFIALNGGF